MPLNVRRGIASLDDVLASVRVNAYNAETVVMSWDRKYRRAAVMGLLDERSMPIEDVRPDVLARLTGLIAHPLEPDVLRLAYPDARLHHSGQIILNVPVDEPVWARVLDTVELSVQAGLRVSSEDIRDAVWVTLEAAGVPSGSVTVERTVMFPELPDTIQFEPVSVSENQAGNGASRSWDEARASFVTPMIATRLTSLVNELAVRQEQEQNLGTDGKIVLTRAVVNT